MGTALTPEHVQHLSHFTKRSSWTYDGDKAFEATAKALMSCSDLELRRPVSQIRWTLMSTSKRRPQEDLASSLKNFLDQHGA